MTEELKIYAEPITSLYYIKTKLPDELMSLIKEDISYLSQNKQEFEKWNEHLAGNVSEEYRFSGKSYDGLKQFVLTVAENYFYVLEDEKLDPIKKWIHRDNFFETKRYYELESLWINLQKKYEYNPIHSHSGDYSFVIWIQIPYNLQEELNLENSVNANEPGNSLFYFHFNSVSGDFHCLPLEINSDWEGTMVMFPSWLLHSVHPFYTSDDYRISIAGNIYQIEEN